MSEFIFAIAQLDEDERRMSGIDYTIIVSTKTYFDKEKCVQDDYTPEEYDQLIAVMNKHDALEVSESEFENEILTSYAMTKNLNAEPLFTFSQELQDFIDNGYEIK